MSLPTTHLAFEAEIDVLERATAAKKGFRLNFSTREEAYYYRIRLYSARRAERLKNNEIYKPGDPLYGSCAYDGLVLRLKEDSAGEWWIYIEKNEIFAGHMEEL